MDLHKKGISKSKIDRIKRKTTVSIKCHPMDFENWLLNRGWPFNTIEVQLKFVRNGSQRRFIASIQQNTHEHIYVKIFAKIIETKHFKSVLYLHIKF